MSKNTKKTKYDYGYSEEIKETYFQFNPTSRKGSFQLLKKKNDWYWYFLLSGSGGNRLKYICKTFEGKVNGKTSFQYCLDVLSQKQLEDFQPKLQSSMRIGKLIDEYIGHLLKENNDTDGRMYETIQSLKNSINRFDDFTKIEDVRFGDIENGRKLKEIIKNYIEFCKNRGLTRHTTKTYVKGVKQFLDWLSDEDSGRGLISSHPITTQFINKVYPPTRKDTKGSINNLSYKREHYDTMFNTCLHKVRDLWTEFIENGSRHVKKSRFHTEGVGSDIVYFISLFQLHSGFRFGEILTSYRSKKYWEKRVDKKNSSTYWDKRKGGWLLILEDFKGKDGIVPFDLSIRTWVKPSCKTKTVKDKNGKVLYYDTQLVEICKMMFRESQYMFSSSNINTHKNRHMSKTHYSQIFKSIMVEKEKFKKYDVTKSHNLRSYFISHMISEGQSLTDLSKITRHSIQTMMKFYERLGEEVQIERQERLNKSRTILKRRDIRNQDK